MAKFSCEIKKLLILVLTQGSYKKKRVLLPFETFMMTQLKGIELRTQQYSYGLSRLWTTEGDGYCNTFHRVAA